MKAIIAGTGVEKVVPFGGGVRTGETKYGPVDYMSDGEVVLVLRHRMGHSVAPHLIDYRANVEFLRSLGVDECVTTYAVGSITSKLSPTRIGLVSDFIDFTSGRKSTFFDGDDGIVKHTEMTSVYDNELLLKVLKSATSLGQTLSTGLVYITTNGPRLETPAEIRAYRILGADVVGMTLNPEINLLREVGIAVQSLCFSINWAAGLDEEGVSFIEEESEKRLSRIVFDIANNALRL